MPGPRTERMQMHVDMLRKTAEEISRQTRHFGGSSPSPAGETSVWLKLKSVDANGKYTVRRVSIKYNTTSHKPDVTELGESDEYGYEINGWKVMPKIGVGLSHLVRAWPSSDSASESIWAFAMTMPPMTAADDYKLLQLNSDDEFQVGFVEAHD